MLKEHAAPKTLSEAIRFFANPDTAMAFVVTLRWPSGVSCPRCNAEKPSYLRSRRIWKCRSCKRQFSVKVGTIFEDSPLSLDKWLPALWMLANCKNGISSYELGRALGVTQKTAWFMLGRIRLAMQTKSFFQKLDGEVEADETFIGGLAKNMHMEKRMRTPRKGTTLSGKVAVMGLLQRRRGQKHAEVRLNVIKTTRVKEVESHIYANVEKGSDMFTDKLQSYQYLKRNFNHEAIDHGVEYARGRVHTNGLENFWSLLKRSIKGTYVSVDPFHLFRYLDEQAFRFNKRHENDLGRFVRVLRDVIGKRITYSELISADMIPATT